MDNNRRALSIYRTAMTDLTAVHPARWQSFLEFASDFYKHDFDNIVMIYAQRRSATKVAGRAIWERLHQELLPDQRAIIGWQQTPRFLDDASPTLEMYDISQTQGDREALPKSWEYPIPINEPSSQVDSFSLMAMDIISSGYEPLYQKKPYMRGVGLEENSDMQEAIIRSALTLIAERCGIPYEPMDFSILQSWRGNNEILSAIGYASTYVARTTLGRIEEEALGLEHADKGVHKPKEISVPPVEMVEPVMTTEAVPVQTADDSISEPEIPPSVFKEQPVVPTAIHSTPQTLFPQLIIGGIRPYVPEVDTTMPLIPPVAELPENIDSDVQEESSKGNTIEEEQQIIELPSPNEREEQQALTDEGVRELPQETFAVNEEAPEPTIDIRVAEAVIASIANRMEPVPEIIIGETCNRVPTPLPTSDSPSVPSVKNFVLTSLDQTGGAKKKYKQNIAAIRLLKSLEEGQRDATPEEQRILALYAGWGGLPQVFDSTNTEWRSEYIELEDALTDDEYEKARGSTLNAHYTSLEVVDAMYDILRRFGYQGGGNILEPAMGVGNFFGRLPEDMQSTLHGVEIDSISGRIAQKLYPEAHIQVTGFESADIADESIDIAIGNVPFGNFSVFDPQYRNHKFPIHDYFIAKTLDKLRPGGIMLYITSTGTLDKLNDSCRIHLAQRADLLGAIRLPNNTFRANAGTEVTTDIVIFKKLMEPRADLEGLEWIHTAIWDEEGASLPLNQYFAYSPSMLMGTLAASKNMYGSEQLVLEPLADMSLSQQLADAIKYFPTGVYTPYEFLLRKKGIGEFWDYLPADLRVKNGGYAVVRDVAYQRHGSVMVSIDHDLSQPESRLRGLTEIKMSLRDLIDAQLDGCSDTVLENLQRRLTEVYDNYVDNFGFINNPVNQRTYEQDPDIYLLSSLEIRDTVDEKKYHKAGIFSMRTIQARRTVEHVETADDALRVSMHEIGRIDPDFMARIANSPAESIIEELSSNRKIYLLPRVPESTEDETWVTASQYLSGNVRKKLREAMENAGVDARFRVNIEALQAVVPPNLGPAEIEASLGATWIPTGVITDFVGHITGCPTTLIRTDYSEVDSSWAIDLDRRANVNMLNSYSVYGMGEYPALSLIKSILNMKKIVVYGKDENGSSYVREAETAEAQEKAELIKNEFRRWVWSSQMRTDRLVTIYNDTFNCLVHQAFDGSELEFPGMVDGIQLRDHQKNAVARILYGGQNTLLAHAVGAGKTFEMVAAAMELKRIGIAQKPMLVVPNSLVGQWAGEFARLYPDAKVLAITPKDFEASNRKRFLSSIAMNEWDAVIIAHSSFGKIDVSPEQQRQFIDDEIGSLTAALKTAGSRHSIKAMEKRAKSLQTSLSALLDQQRDGIMFEELGVDYLFIDEAHEFKNLGVVTRMSDVAGVSTTAAKKSNDLLMKIRLLSERAKGPCVVFATGTPIANSITEMYTMLRYLHIDRLQEMKIDTFDSWASTFGKAVTAYEIAPDGSGFRQKTRFSEFHNVPELLTLFREIADIRTAEELQLPIPALSGGKATVITAPRTPELRDFVDSLVERSEAIRGRRVKPKDDNMLKITTEGRKAALDMRLVAPDTADFPLSKVNVAARNIFEIWGSTRPNGLTQLVFCDISTPQQGFSVYTDLKSKLIQLGIPSNEIAFAHDASTDKERQALRQRVIDGKIRVLMGSTSKMGTGMNVQKRLIAEHHLDVPWRPADIEQREGRILRQGNENSEVQIYRYVTEGSFDAYSYQLIESKARFISQIMVGTTERSIEDVDDRALTYAEVKAIASGDPRIMERFVVDSELVKLEMLETGYKQNLMWQQGRLREFPQYERRTLERIDHLMEDMEAAKRIAAGSFIMSVDGKIYTSKREAGAALLDYINYRSMRSGAKHALLGEIGGFTLVYEDPRTLIIWGKTTRNINFEDSGMGLIQRIQNVLASIETSTEYAQEELERRKKELVELKELVQQPFSYADRLEELRARKAALDAVLDLDQKPIMGTKEGCEEEGKKAVADMSI